MPEKHFEIERDYVDRVILVCVATRENESYCEESLDELEELANTAGAITLEKVIQNRESVHPGTYLGKGKIAEIKELIYELDATGIICDDELSPAQLKNLEDVLECKIMDRTMLILDIFAKRAHTREGIIQVELAQLQYRLSRLAGIGTSLSRLGGGIGTRGPGEKKLETDRRHIRNRISQLKKELLDVKNHRDLIRERRKKQGKVKIAIVGYTNAGKSTLLNKLTDAEVLEEDKLFATLDPTTRQLILPNGTEVLLTDTVGFIRKLPHHLIKAFHSTLEEAVVADILIHVVDSANEQANSHIRVVYETLEELGATGKTVITVFNKIDKEGSNKHLEDYNAYKTLMVSVKEGTGLEELLDIIEKKIQQDKILIKEVISYDNGNLLNQIRINGQIIKEEYRNEGTYIEAYVDDKTYGELNKIKTKVLI
ncbi:GTPase HflX [Vallitalea guaymasensis]|uniref:GTPase HflX n=1 Tax=Vallitalea guaymasensis TaxID=1185412 RepID=A0A8J8SCX9_9FIRM|nr:GTPase HflX [Vallitalea guaymasensis]QUH30323.1 GTPase HflX [Vallitalea guaymasensis]